MGFDELLRVLREEAASEERAFREEGAREAERIVEEARNAAARVRDAAIAREEGAQAARLRAVRERAGLERERALLREGRRQLELLRSEALARLPGEVTGSDVERFVTELVREAGPVSAVLAVDPAASPAARKALAALGATVELQESPEVHGGVQLITGLLVLDDTAAARLERAWPRVEPEIARLLLSEG